MSEDNPVDLVKVLAIYFALNNSPDGSKLVTGELPIKDYVDKVEKAVKKYESMFRDELKLCVLEHQKDHVKIEIDKCTNLLAIIDKWRNKGYV